MARISTVSSPVGPRSIWTRKLDFFYVVFVGLAIFLAFTTDMIPLYPVTLPTWASALRTYYISTYNDPLYILDPPFFRLYSWMLVFPVVPGGAWIVRSLIKDDEAAPLYLLIWAVHYNSASLVCLYELFSVNDWPKNDIDKTWPPYALFLGIGVGIMLDMSLRIKKVLVSKEKSA